MDKTPNLQLSLIANKQGLRPSFHDDALKALDTLVMLSVLDRDLSSPPASPADGDRYIVKAPGSGDPAWVDDNVVVYLEGGWRAHEPQLGWTCYVQDEGALLAWDGSSWQPAIDVMAAGAELQNLGLLGIGTSADATDPLSAKLNNVLWTARTVAEGGDGNLRHKLSKESASKSLSLLFQDNYSGRAEIGLTGDDDCHFKVSADGSSWLDAIVIDKTTGKLTIGQGFVDEVAVRAKAYAAPFDAMAGLGAEVNGRVDISQELGTTGATLANNTNKYTADLWEAMYNHGAASAVVTSGQVALSGGTALAGFGYGHQIKATTAISSIANGDFARHRHQIEGWRAAKFGFGTADAFQAAVFAKFYSTASFTAMLRLSNAAGNRAYHRELTIAAGWNSIREVIPGDTSGTWEITTSAGLIVDFFSAGKAASPATPNAWGTTPAVQSTNSGNGLGTNNNLTIVTGLKVLPVVSALELPSSERAALITRPYPDEVRACRRLYRYDATASRAAASGLIYSSTLGLYAYGFDVEMRATPTFSVSAASDFRAVGGGATFTASAIGTNGLNKTGTRLDVTISGATAGHGSVLEGANANAVLKFDARL